jgi:hypothetical protein
MAFRAGDESEEAFTGAMLVAEFFELIRCTLAGSDG